MIQKHRFFAIALLFVGVALPFSSAKADFIYSGCDYLSPLGATNIQAVYTCQGSLDITRSLQGIEFIVNAINSGGSTPNPLYVRVSPDGSSTFLPTGVLVDPTGWVSGSHVVVDLSSLGISISAGNQPIVALCTDPTDSASCTGAHVLSVGHLSPNIPYQVWYWDGDTPGLINTRIDTLTPGNNSVQSTSTPVSIASTGYVNLNDENPKLELEISITSPALAGRISQCADVLCSLDPVGLATRTYDFSLASGSPDLPDGFGGFSVSTSSTLGIGNYRMTASIKNPGTSYFFGLFGSPGYTLVATTTSFIVGTSTTSGGIINGILNNIGSSLTSDTGPDGSSCSPISFDLAHCFALLFYPDPGQLKVVLDSAKTGFLSVVPFGYVSLLYNAISTTTQTQLPNISYTFPSNYPAALFAGTTWGFNFNTILAQAADIASSTTSNTDNPKNVWDILMPTINIIIWLLLAFMIVHDLTGIHRQHESSAEGNRRQA